MRNVLFNNHPFGCSLFKRWSFQLTKTDQRKFPFRCSFCLGRLWVACADKKEIDDPWKRRNIYQLYQFFGGSSRYFCGGVFFFGWRCSSIFMNFSFWKLRQSDSTRFLGIPRVWFRNMVLSSIFFNNFDTACDNSPFACWQRSLRWTFGRIIWFTSWSIDR